MMFFSLLHSVLLFTKSRTLVFVFIIFSYCLKLSLATHCFMILLISFCPFSAFSPQLTPDDSFSSPDPIYIQASFHISSLISGRQLILNALKQELGRTDFSLMHSISCMSSGEN